MRPHISPDWGDWALKGLLALATYFFGRWQKSGEVTNSDLKERADEICKLIDKVVEDAAGYYSRDRVDDDEKVERRLKSDLLHLERLRVHCAEDAPAFDKADYRGKHNFFNDAVTDGDFEQKLRKAASYRADRIRSLGSALSVATRQARRRERDAILPLWLRRLW